MSFETGVHILWNAITDWKECFMNSGNWVEKKLQFVCDECYCNFKHSSLGILFSDCLCDLIKHLQFVKLEKDNVMIRQGDIGEW